MDADFILEKLDMRSIEQRRDSQLDITKIPKTYYEKNTMSGSITLDRIKELYKTGPLYEDHLVVKLTGYPEFMPPTNGEKFDDKVIFIVDDNASLKGQYFSTTTNSSTMIYVGDNGQVENGFKLNGLFQGLIYISENNNRNNYISFGANDTIAGAIHSFSKKPISWNTGNGSAPPVIKFDPNVLKQFASFVKCVTDPCEEAKYTTEYSETNTERKVRLRALGYYFY